MPDQHIAKILKNVGFKNIDVRSKQKMYTFKNLEKFRGKNKKIGTCNNIKKKRKKSIK